LQVGPPNAAPPNNVAFGVDIVSPDGFNNNTLTEELRLSSNNSSPWQWTVGGFFKYFRTSTALSSYFGLVDGPLPAAPGSSLGTASSKANAAFFDTNYKFFDRLTFGVGARYYTDEESAAPPAEEATFHSVDPRAYAQFALTDSSSIYATVAKGFRSGGLNGQTGQPPFGPENVWNYEFGAKADLDDHRLNLDADIFYTKYLDYQAVGFDPNSAVQLNFYRNSGDAWIRGVEWDFRWQPVDEWSFSLNGNYMDTRFYRLNAEGTYHNVGDPVDFVPKYEVTASAQRNFDWSGKRGFFRLDYQRRGPSYWELRSLAPWFNGESDVINILNFNANIQLTDTLGLGLFGQNLTNNRGFLSPENEFDRFAARSKPRTIGVRFSVNVR